MEHHFNTELAKEYGIEAAILLHHFYYWTAKNAANDKHFHDGLYWTYNSRAAYAKFFVYMSEDKIYRTIKKLCEIGLVVKGSFNENKMDKTNWYAITKDGLNLLYRLKYDMTPFASIAKGEIRDCANTHGHCADFNNDCADSRNGLDENAQPITYNNTDNNNTDKIKEKKESKLSSKKTAENEFAPPTFDEVSSYIKKKGYHIDARSFIDYYEADDWNYTSGGKRHKVENWKRCLSTWENTYRRNHPEESNQPQKDINPDDVLVQKFLDKIASGEITLEQESGIYGNVLDWWLYEATETNRNYWRNVYREKIIEWMKSHA